MARSMESARKGADDVNRAEYRTVYDYDYAQSVFCGVRRPSVQVLEEFVSPYILYRAGDVSSILLMGYLVYRGGSWGNDSIGNPSLLQVPSAWLGGTGGWGALRLLSLSLRLIDPLELLGI